MDLGLYMGVIWWALSRVLTSAPCPFWLTIAHVGCWGRYPESWGGCHHFAENPGSKGFSTQGPGRIPKIEPPNSGLYNCYGVDYRILRWIF